MQAQPLPPAWLAESVHRRGTGRRSQTPVNASCAPWLLEYAAFHAEHRHRPDSSYLVYTCRPVMPQTNSHCLGFACVETCRKGIEKGREVKADFKIVAKSYARIGNAYIKQGMYDEGIRAFEDSMMEDRTEAVEKSLKAAQKEKKKRAEEAYMSPELAEKAREEGNELFKAGKYPAAIEKYTDAMKRNPKSATPYSNRAACYQKLMEWQLALKDAETCVTMDPTYLKGWSRKAGIHLFLKEFHKSMDCYNKVLELDPNNADAKNNLEHVISKINESNQSGEADPERQKRAMADPEIQAILGDPQMRSILNEMQTDPKKANAAMQDPDISAKLQKLIAAGVLQVR